ncbi:MAG TPA: hypothetical protein VMY42_19810 [Thermoguttaceae bacterium]|nr:hypothetical protein [Thermoguttaceae bacterium]
MRCLVSALSIAAMLMMVSITVAEEQAATSQLPAALQAIGVDETGVVSAEQAHQVRGRSYEYYLLQEKSFSISHGVATGTTNLLEGVFGNFKYVDFSNGGESGTSLTVEGTFGGLTGSIGVTDSGLEFTMLGKAFQESFDFAGKMSQDFSQLVKIPVPVVYLPSP